MNTLNLSTKRGDTFAEVPFQINVNTVPLNLSGALIRMQLRTDYGGTVYLEFTSVNNDGITITNAANGEFKINETIIDLEAKAYKYDIEITLSKLTLLMLLIQHLLILVYMIFLNSPILVLIHS
jgi:hypothetical protein